MDQIYLLSPWCEREYHSAPTSLLYLKYYLRDHDYNATVIDCSHHDRDYKSVADLIKESRRPVIGITAYTRERFNAYRLAATLKREAPDSTIVVGGRHFGYLAEETLRELPEVDIVVRGEGEITFKEICDALLRGKGGVKDVPGLSYRSPDGICHNPDRPLYDDLDRFRSFDASDTDEVGRYALTGYSKVDADRKFFSVMATRGCPNRCIYCSLTASKVRYRSVGSIIREIEEKIKVTGTRNVTFADSSLTINRHFVEELCNEIISRKLDIRFNCYSRVNIDVSLLSLMKKAGLLSVEVGLESGSPRVLKAIRKNIKVEEFREFCKVAYREGIRVYVFCMLSLPEETYEDAEITLSLVKDVSRYIYYIGIQTTRILPDAALQSVAREKGLLPQNFSWFQPYEIPAEHKALAKDRYYDSIPLYLEHLSVEQIRKLLARFEGLQTTSLSSFNTLKKAIRYNLSREGLEGLHWKNLGRKAGRLFSMAYHAYRNRNKELRYTK